MQPTIPITSVVASVTQALPAGWEEATAENGKKYYCNISTGQTYWQAPTVQCPPPPLHPPDKGPCLPPQNQNPAGSAPPTNSLWTTGTQATPV